MMRKMNACLSQGNFGPNSLKSNWFHQNQSRNMWLKDGCSLRIPYNDILVKLFIIMVSINIRRSNEV